MKLDLQTEEVTQKFAEAPIYAKKAIVSARQSAVGEKVQTILEDGTVETVNTAEEGDIIVTNPGGESYILKPDNFAKRYEATEEDGVFRAKGMARAYQNDTGHEITVIAPWGEEQHGGADCMIANVFDPDNPERIGIDRSVIGAQEFAETYGLAEEVLRENP